MVNNRRILPILLKVFDGENRYFPQRLLTEGLKDWLDPRLVDSAGTFVNFRPRKVDLFNEGLQGALLALSVIPSLGDFRFNLSLCYFSFGLVLALTIPRYRIPSTRKSQRYRGFFFVPTFLTAILKCSCCSNDYSNRSGFSFDLLDVQG